MPGDLLEVPDSAASLIWNLVFATVLIVIGCAAAWRVRAARRAREGRSAPEPLARAVERLRRLQGEERVESAQVGEDYLELSDLVRDYLADRMELPAPELTTAELFSRDDLTAVVPQPRRAELEDLLVECDLFKFSGDRAGPREWRRSLEATENWLRCVDEERRSVGESARSEAEVGVA